MRKNSAVRFGDEVIVEHTCNTINMFSFVEVLAGWGLIFLGVFWLFVSDVFFAVILFGNGLFILGDGLRRPGRVEKTTRKTVTFLKPE